MFFKFGRPYNDLNIFTYDLVAAPGFEGVAFPMIRRVFARLLADDIVAVQPMAAPRGILHFLTHPYEGYIKIKEFKFGRKWKQQ